MAAVGFDSFEYAKELESAGMSRQLAEVVARGMANSFVLNFDALVTRDYLDARLDQFRGEFNARFEQIDARFERIDARFEQIDARFQQIEARFDARFEHHQALTDARFDQFSAEFNGKLRSIQVTQAILLAGVAVPVIQSLMVWFN